MGNSYPKLLSNNNPIVVVLGGGAGGIAVAQTLDATDNYRVVLIDRKNYYLHNIAALRASTEKNYATNVLIPFSNLLKNGAFIQAEVKEVTDKSVLLHGYNESIPFDYLVIALGSTYPFPEKITEPDREKALVRYHQIREKIANAKSIIIIGGGPVGIELAGEIRDQSKDHSITLIHSHSSLLNDNLKQELRDRLLSELRKVNVEVVLNSRAELTDSQLNYRSSTSNSFIDSSTPSALRTIQTSTGKSFTADLILFCHGTKSNNASLTNHFHNVINDEGRLLVDSSLRVKGYSNIFAIGDIAAADQKLAYAAGLQAALTTENISLLTKAASSGKNNPTLKTYTALLPVLFVPIGRGRGAGQMPNKGGTVVGNTLTSMLKGKELFVNKSWATLKATSLKASLIKNDSAIIENYQNDERKLNDHEKNNMKGVKKELIDIRAKNLSTAIGVTEKNAQSLMIAGLPLPEHPPTVDAL